MDEAATPVIAVIMMVAIAVVASVLLYSFVDQDNRLQETSTDLSLRKVEHRDQVEVLRAPADLRWEDLLVRSDQPLKAAVGQDAASGGPVGTEPVRLAGGQVRAGGHLNLCAQGPAEAVEVQVLHEPSGSLAFDDVFLRIQECGA